MCHSVIRIVYTYLYMIDDVEDVPYVLITSQVCGTQATEALRDMLDTEALPANVSKPGGVTPWRCHIHASKGK